jgi:hypothetical protein
MDYFEIRSTSWQDRKPRLNETIVFEVRPSILKSKIVVSNLCAVVCCLYCVSSNCKHDFHSFGPFVLLRSHEHKGLHYILMNCNFNPRPCVIYSGTLNMCIVFHCCSFFAEAQYQAPLLNLISELIVKTWQTFQMWSKIYQSIKVDVGEILIENNKNIRWFIMLCTNFFYVEKKVSFFHHFLFMTSRTQ